MVPYVDPVLVIGMHRSGTTMLTKMLDELKGFEDLKLPTGPKEGGEEDFAAAEHGRNPGEDGRQQDQAKDDRQIRENFAEQDRCHPRNAQVQQILAAIS